MYSTRTVFVALLVGTVDKSERAKQASKDTKVFLQLGSIFAVNEENYSTAHLLLKYFLTPISYCYLHFI